MHREKDPDGFGGSDIFAVLRLRLARRARQTPLRMTDSVLDGMVEAGD